MDNASGTAIPAILGGIYLALVVLSALLTIVYRDGLKGGSNRASRRRAAGR